MIKLFDSYTDYLSSNPGEFTGLLLWVIANCGIYAVLFFFRKRMVNGASGENGFLESPEQVMYIMNWVWPPIVTYSAFFHQDLSVSIWYFMAACIGWALSGRWLFEWALALRAGKTTVDESAVTLTNKTTETKMESVIKTETDAKA